MAQSKKSSKAAIDPFKTRATKEVTQKANDTINPPSEVAEAIDAFRQAQDQAKHYEGEATIQKDAVLQFCEKEYVQRLLNGQNNSFKVLGHDNMVTYVVMDASSGLTDEDVAQIEERWGRGAAEALVTRDFASIRFDAKVLESNYDQVVGALQHLPEEVLANLFKPMLMKAQSGAAELAKKYAKGPEELAELLKMLKIKNYIR